MSRLSQARQTQLVNESDALLFFKSVLSSLPDPRRRQGQRYPFESVVVIALMSSICGAEDAQAMENWGTCHQDWLSGFLDLPHGIPSQDVFLSVFASLNPSAFEELLRAWANLLTTRLQGQQIVLDGKTSRRSFSPANHTSAIHLLNAYSVDSGLVVGQMNVEGKTNEITAMPKLLKLLDIRGTTITTDAMGCQESVASTIIEQGGEYILAVKENQPSLFHDLETAFDFLDDKEKQAGTGMHPCKVECHCEVDKGHGRLEERKIEVSRDLSWLSDPAKWSNLNFFARVTRQRMILSTGEVTTNTSYYIGSESNAEAKDIAQKIRAHWSIENKVHWVLDMGFREDEARHRSKNTGQNMAVIRKFAFNIIKQDKNRKVGVANSRKMAGWNKQYLLELLTKSVT